MTSRITIEVDFDNGQPYIQIVEDLTSNDVRDKLITFFRQRLGYQSNWCRIGFMGAKHVMDNDGIKKWTIHPVTDLELDEMKKELDKRIESMPPIPTAG